MSSEFYWHLALKIQQILSCQKSTEYIRAVIFSVHLQISYDIRSIMSYDESSLWHCFMLALLHYIVLAHIIHYIVMAHITRAPCSNGTVLCWHCFMLALFYVGTVFTVSLFHCFTVSLFHCFTVSLFHCFFHCFYKSSLFKRTFSTLKSSSMLTLCLKT